MNDRVLRLARRAALWIIGPVFLLFGSPLASLGPPVACAGALELFSILVARAWPDLAIGSLFALLQAAAVTIAFGCFAELAYRASGSIPAAAVLTTTLGISHPFGDTFSLPWTAAAFGACAAVALALYELFQTSAGSPGSHRSAIGASAALLMAAAIIPAWTVPCVLLVFAVAWRGFDGTARYQAAVAGAASIFVAAVLVLIARTANATGPESWTACVWSPDGLGRVKALALAIDASGALVLALSALGAYATAASSGGTHTSLGAGVVALAMVSLLGTRSADRVLEMPALAAVWYLAAAGIREMHIRVLNRRALVSALLLAVLPALQLSRAHVVDHDLSAGARRAKAEGLSRPATGTLLGHDRVSLAQIRRLLNLVPDRATIVEEDASVDLLLRASAFGRRPAKSLATVPSTRKDVAAALKSGRVYAFPLGQRELSLRGFAIDVVMDLPGTDSRGLATVATQRACVEIGRTWVDLDGVGDHGRVSLVADTAPAVGPVVIYFSGENGYTPGPDGWSPELVPGFALQMFDRSDPARAARLEAEAAAAGLRDHPVFASPYVARLTLSRLPRAPLALPIVLGPPRAHGVGRLTAASADALPLSLCDAPGVRVSEFLIPRS